VLAAGQGIENLAGGFAFDAGHAYYSDELYSSALTAPDIFDRTPAAVRCWSSSGPLAGCFVRFVPLMLSAHDHPDRHARLRTRADLRKMREMAVRSETWRIGAAVIAALACLAGCDGDGRTELGLSVGAAAQFQAQEGPPRVVGYQLAVVIEQVTPSGATGCRQLPADLHLMVNGTEVPAAYDPSNGCLLTTVTSDLTPQVGTVTADAMDGNRALGHAEFSGLAPGGAATLAVPADGAVHLGYEVVVVPPPDLSTAYAGPAYVYPLDDMTVSSKLIPSQAADREADGIHLVVPAFSGRAAIAFWGMPYVPQPTYSCPGFDFCTANADNTVGPVFVTESP
jgi:hypothetical protein